MKKYSVTYRNSEGDLVTDEFHAWDIAALSEDLDSMFLYKEFASIQSIILIEE